MARGPKLRAIVLDMTAGNRLRFAKVRKGKETNVGKVVSVSQSGYALLGKSQVWTLQRWRRDRKYVLMLEGDPRPLVIDAKSIKPAPMDMETFKAAVTTTISTRFMVGQRDWKVAVMLMLGFIIVIMALVIYGMGRPA